MATLASFRTTRIYRKACVSSIINKTVISLSFIRLGVDILNLFLMFRYLLLSLIQYGMDCNGPKAYSNLKLY